MKLDIYIHGVPNGQRIWSTGGEDQIINQFYGAGGEEQTKFLAEVRKSGGQNYCYYSLLKYKNVSAENGRAGSYFGLTIKMDMVCTKVETIFHILDMIYGSTILNKFLKKEGERLQYVVGDFKDKESQCKTVVDKVMNVLGQSVDGGDFVNITSSMLSGKGTPKVNIAEYTSESAFAIINQNGGIAVSSAYPSVQLASYIKKKDAEVNSIKLQSQQEVNSIKQQSQQEVSRIQQQASQNIQEQERKNSAALQQVRDQANRETEKIKAQYADVDKKLRAYEQQQKQLLKENNELKRTVEEQNKKITKLENSVQGTGTYGPTLQKPSVIKSITTKVLPFVNLLIGLVVLVALFLRMPSDNSKKIDQISDDLVGLKDSVATIQMKLDTNLNGKSDLKTESSNSKVEKGKENKIGSKDAQRKQPVDLLQKVKEPDVKDKSQANSDNGLKK